MTKRKDLQPQPDNFIPETNEIESLNLDSLDVEELERRLEMSTGDMVSAAWICGTNDNTCQPVCGTNNPCSPVVSVPIDIPPAE